MRTIVAAAFAAALGASATLAQDKQAPEKKALTEQQQRTEACTQQARDRKLQGRERSQFMSACMRGEKPK